MRLRGSVKVSHTLAQMGANRLWSQLKTMPYVHSLGAVTGNQAMQMARAGLNAIYLSGWQVAADANTAGAMYPDQSLYPANAGPELCRRINRTLQRADQIEHSEGGAKIDWFVPIVADAEAGFGGPLNSFEIMKAYIEAGAAGVHFEDQLASEKKCGHMGGKVLIPTAAHERNLIAARLAADVCGVPTLVLARTDAESAKLITSDIDERDREFITGERTAEGFFRLKEGTGLAHCIKRGIAFARHADLIWWRPRRPISMRRASSPRPCANSVGLMAHSGQIAQISADDFADDRGRWEGARLWSPGAASSAKADIAVGFRPAVPPRLRPCKSRSPKLRARIRCQGPGTA